MTALIEDQEIALFQQWLENTDDAPPCSLRDCDEPATHKWVVQPCGCVWLMCDQHHAACLRLKANGMRTRFGTRTRCDLTTEPCGVILTGGTHHPI